MRRVFGRTLLVASLAVLVPLGGDTPQGATDPSSPAAPGVAFALAGARRDPRFPEPVDLVIETRAQWREHMAAARRSPFLFDGMVVGVVLPESARSPESGRLTANADADRTAADQDKVIAAPTVPCAADRGSPATDYGVHLACRGREPDSYFVKLHPASKRPRTTTEQDVRSRLLMLMEQPPPEFAVDGYYSVLADGSNTIASVALDGATLTIDFTPAILDLGIDELARGAAFLDQVLATSLSAHDDIRTVELTLEGDCHDFWRALGGTGCHALTKSDLQERG